MSGQLEYAVAALCVIDAFEHIEEGQLVATYVETTSDLFNWVICHQRWWLRLLMLLFRQ